MIIFILVRINYWQLFIKKIIINILVLFGDKQSFVLNYLIRKLQKY